MLITWSVLNYFSEIHKFQVLSAEDPAFTNIKTKDLTLSFLYNDNSNVPQDLLKEILMFWIYYKTNTLLFKNLIEVIL